MTLGAACDGFADSHCTADPGNQLEFGWRCGAPLALPPQPSHAGTVICSQPPGPLKREPARVVSIEGWGGEIGELHPLCVSKSQFGRLAHLNCHRGTRCLFITQSLMRDVTGQLSWAWLVLMDKCCPVNNLHQLYLVFRQRDKPTNHKMTWQDRYQPPPTSSIREELCIVTNPQSTLDTDNSIPQLHAEICIIHIPSPPPNNNLITIRPSHSTRTKSTLQPDRL